jgi:hypothetical protein
MKFLKNHLNIQPDQLAGFSKLSAKSKDREKVKKMATLPLQQKEM